MTLYIWAFQVSWIQIWLISVIKGLIRQVPGSQFGKNFKHFKILEVMILQYLCSVYLS